MSLKKKTPNPNTLCILKSKQKQAVESDNKQKNTIIMCGLRSLIALAKQSFLIAVARV